MTNFFSYKFEDNIRTYWGWNILKHHFIIVF